jgi:hypothetical protein
MRTATGAETIGAIAKLRLPDGLQNQTEPILDQGGKGARRDSCLTSPSAQTTMRGTVYTGISSVAPSTTTP